MKAIKKLIKSLVLLILVIVVIIFVKNRIDLADSDLLDKVNIFRKEKDMEDDNYNSQYVYVLNRQEDIELIRKNHKKKAYPASLTKIMTTLVALEHIEDLSEIAPVDVASYQDMVAKNASMAGFYGREPVTYRDLLYGTMLNSGGEAANSLAINISGDVNSFVKLMNEKARELGLKDTNFTNPEGLQDKDQYTTASDMGKLLDHALDNGHFKAIFTKRNHTTVSTLDHPNGIVLKSTVLSRLDGVEDDSFKIRGGKSGTTYEAGQCWATVGTKGGREYIVITMGVPLEDIHKPSGGQIEDTLEIFKNIE